MRIETWSDCYRKK